MASNPSIHSWQRVAEAGPRARGLAVSLDYAAKTSFRSAFPWHLHGKRFLCPASCHWTPARWVAWARAV